MKESDRMALLAHEQAQQGVTPVFVNFEGSTESIRARLPVDARPPTGSYITREMLEAAFERMRQRERIVHGSPRDPHIVHPKGGYCFGCGQFFESPLQTGSDSA